MVQFSTQRLFIRPFSLEDKDDLYYYLSKEEVVRYEPYSVYTMEEARMEAAVRSVDERFLAVQLKGGPVIGNLYFVEGEYHTWEVGYVFNNDFWKQGYARESVGALLTHLFGSLAARKVIANCNPANQNSWHLLERLGFTREAHLRQNIFFTRNAKGEPNWQDTLVYGLLKEEWPQPEEQSTK
ncbi:MAG: GNAT family N-acetyltransferase [Anaerolineaceae bacterium]|nr:GNAT family N-acetyltransferase [Anaerolineaceae bacterium]